MNKSYIAFGVGASILAAGAAYIATRSAPTVELSAASLLARSLGEVTTARMSASAVSRANGGSSESEAPFTTEKLCELDEQDFNSIERSVLHGLEKALLTGNTSAVASVFAEEARVASLGSVNSDARRTVGTIREFDWQAAAPVTGSEAATQALAAYAKGFTSLVDVQLDGAEIRADKSQRNADNLAIEKATVLTRFDVRGVEGESTRRHDRGELAISVARSGDGWKVTGIDVVKAETLRSDKPSFADETMTAGLDKLTTYPRIEAIRRGGYAQAAGDFDGDGNVDLYVGAYGPGTLLKGDGKGGFAPARDAGLSEDTLVKTAIFGDFFNSGRQDLLLVRFEPDVNVKNEIVFYRNVGEGKFEKAQVVVRDRGHDDYAMPAAAGDFNRDGLLDFYVGFPGVKDFTNLADKSEQRKRVQGVFMNDGKAFQDATGEAFAGAPDYAQGRTPLFPHSAVSFDYDQDGDSDLVVMDDRGNVSPMFRNDGQGRFEEVSRSIGIDNADYGMSAAVGDVNNDGVFDLAMTNVNFAASERMNRSCEANFGKTYARVGERGVLLYNGKGDGQFGDATRTSGLDFAGEGLAGIEFVDYNNDGLLDIYVANGLWSGTDRTQDLGSTFIRNYTQLESGRIEDKRSGGDSTEALDSGFSNMMTTLRTFEGDVHSPLAPTTKARPSMAGYQRNRLFRNDGAGAFTEVGYLEGADSIYDGYIISVADVDNDGRQDLFLRNADPGTAEYSFPTVQLLRNRNEEGQAVRVTLKGATSNHDGVGATLTATVGGKRFVRHVVANNGTAQSSRLVHFGLGSAEQIDELKIAWPSGREQTLTNVKAGAITVTEDAAAVKTALR